VNDLGKFKGIVADVFGIDKAEVVDSLKYQQIDGWDSLNHLNLVSKLEIEFGLEFDMDEIIAMENIAKIKEMLAAKGITKSELC